MLPDPAVNAWAAPGGYLAIQSGLIDQARGPEEVAAVLAHEMAHVLERHSLEGIIQRLGLAILLSAVFGDAGGIVVEAGQALANLSYSRDAEREADRVGIALMHAAGLDATGMAGFFQRLEAAGQDGPPALLSTHPAPADRVETARALARPGAPPWSDAQWQAIQRICTGG